MKFFNFYFFIIVIIATLATFSFVSSEDAPKYNFGTMQADKSFSVVPGNMIETKLYFYNIYGNRPTHIKINITEKPSSWSVEILPALKTKEYDVSGIKKIVEENLVIYPSNSSQEKGGFIESKEWISSKVGYINADVLTITIRIPSDEQLGKSSKIKINAVAFWLGQGGSVALQQEREFEYTVTTISEEYYETPVETGNIGKKISSIFSQANIKPVYALMTGVTLILVIVLIVLFVLMNKKARKKVKKEKKSRRG